jgi:hypothetical protein
MSSLVPGLPGVQIIECRRVLSWTYTYGYYSFDPTSIGSSSTTTPGAAAGGSSKQAGGGAAAAAGGSGGSGSGGQGGMDENKKLFFEFLQVRGCVIKVWVRVRVRGESETGGGVRKVWVCESNSEGVKE